MARTPDMFPGTKPPPRVLLHVYEANADCEDGPWIVRLTCRKCGYLGDWVAVTRGSLRAGIPCRKCNAVGKTGEP